MSEFDISVEEIVGVAAAAMRGDSLKYHAPAIRQYIDEALMRFESLDEALMTANAVHEATGSDDVSPEDRKVVDAAKAYVQAENRMLHTLLQFADDGGANAMPVGGFSNS